MNLRFEIWDLRSRRGGRWRSLGNVPARCSLVALISLCAGCATLKPSLPVAETKSSVVEAAVPPGDDKQKEVLRQFEERRDNAQLGASLDRWKLGDSAGSEGLLHQLLTRNPAHREARRALADLYAARPDPDAAFEQLRQLLEQDANDAQAHHSLGLLLETLDRSGEALLHFEEAARLDPRNELYALSLDACRAG